MLTAAQGKAVLAGKQGSQDDVGVLSLAETVGNMGYWYWYIQSESLSWSEQV